MLLIASARPPASAAKLLHGRKVVWFGEQPREQNAA